MSRHVLVAIDDSEVSKQALDYALEEFPDASITALHVIESVGSLLSAGFSIDGYDEIPSHEREEAEDLLEEAKQAASDRGIEIRTAIESGKPTREIIRYAEENDVDHVVIGSHGRERSSRILLGSVAEVVTRRSPVPITIVR